MTAAAKAPGPAPGPMPAPTAVLRPTVDGPEWPLDAVTRTFAIVGQRGTGKSTAAADVVEAGVAAGGRFVVIDPTGVWWGLRSSADGAGPGLAAVVLGGEHGDAPLERGAGAVVAEFVTDYDDPVVVLDLMLFTKAARTQFLADFCEALFLRCRQPLHLVLDEADRLAPQMLREAGNAPRLLGALEDIFKLGRSRGLGATAITQRPAGLNKNLLELAETLVSFRLMGPNDRKAIKSWVDANGDDAAAREVMASIASLPQGSAWLWSPTFLEVLAKVRFRRPDTFDSRRTPEVGTARHEPTGRAMIDLAVLRERITSAATAAPGTGDAIGTDPAALQATITELRRELARHPTPPAPQRVEIPVPDPTAAAALRELCDRLGAALADQRRAVAQLNELHTEAAAALRRLDNQRAEPRAVDAGSGDAAASGAAASAEPKPRRARPPSTPNAAAPVPPSPDEHESTRLKSGARRMLVTAARHHPLRVSRAQLGTLTRMRHTGGTFGTYLSVLRRTGLLDLDEQGLVYCTPTGLAEAGVTTPAPMDTDELVEQWRAVLKAGARRMLDVLLDHHPAAVTREQLAAAVDMASDGGTFGTYLSVLRRNGLATVHGAEVTAGDALYLSAAADRRPQ